MKHQRRTKLESRPLSGVLSVLHKQKVAMFPLSIQTLLGPEISVEAVKDALDYLAEKGLVNSSTRGYYAKDFNGPISLDT